MTILPFCEWSKWPFLSKHPKLWDHCQRFRKFIVPTSGPLPMVPKIWRPNFETVNDGPEVWDVKIYWNLADIKWWAKLPFDQRGAIGMESLKWTALVVVRCSTVPYTVMTTTRARRLNGQGCHEDSSKCISLLTASPISGVRNRLIRSPAHSRGQKSSESWIMMQKSP